ncbi:related to ASI3 Putative integral membrane E3 ubiquitin ligase, role in negative regulation of amino acid uptake [Cephalotrichum gorgonifer]|uniref:Related to ASI3 Putative integral membrane E3 ubiquitin ligase, role in negative regulation of amino acid uptake n=1 Tax=Cephalotrichum gorgonifer TaxID=2041049 RepID=A0AAE8N0N2_9PEZI|nr:related to ASI3 Putative integral membrane E3 ubiquitin ligase, role in negative regulation of amino acid uptake [Cephalotrichum gorgonifer]
MSHSSDASDIGPPPGPFGGWQNITTWTAQQFISVVNVSKHVPSFDNLIWAGPRMVRKLGAFMLFAEGIDGLGPSTMSGASEPNGQELGGMATSTIAGDTGTPSAVPITANVTAAGSRLQVEGSRGFGSVFSYATSKWALCCIAMAIILNRAYIFAATRRRLALPWQIKLVIRGAPLLLLAMHARQLLQSLQCQTSTEFASLRWGDPNKSSDLMFAYPNSFLHGLSSFLLFNASDRDSCLSVKMIPANFEASSGPDDIRGSLSILWPLFGTFCLGQLVETIICAVEGRPLTAETGMTLFEHSLAFAEADAAIGSQLGSGVSTSAGARTSSSAVQLAIPISRSMIMSRVNTPPEVLLVAFLSTMAHITSHTLGVFNLQPRFRLASTAVWGLSFMASIFWSVVTFSLDATESQSLMRFPTVCVIGFIPHVLVLSGILVCVSIYGFALGLSALAPPPGQEGLQSTIRQRLAQAQANLQASISFSDLRITREMDFYTALLKAGFGAISLASEAVYLNEDSNVATPNNTWLEERRIQQLEEFQEQWSTRFGDGSGDPFTSGTTPFPQQGASRSRYRNGFAHERPVQKAQKRRPGVDRIRGDGVGAAVRSARWLLAVDYVLNINRVLFKVWIMAILRGLEKLGIRSRPSWLLRWTRNPKMSASDEKRAARTSGSAVTEDTSPMIPGFRVRRSDKVDVEAELRAHIQSGNTAAGVVDEEDLDTKLYDWWLNGRAWGSVDRSGDYAASEGGSDADATSDISVNTADDDEGDWEDEVDDRPSRISPYPARDTSPILDTPIQASDLARLLRPANQEEQDEADTLCAHLASDEILTRSRYQRVKRLQLARVLATGPPGKAYPNIPLRPAKLTHHEEARLLEQILISRREPTAASSSTQNLDSWATGASGLGPGGPQCVVCQTTPRTIIVWPCRCLSLCDDCRVALAMNNFDRCVCCRREVSSFSRIYVP